MGVGRPTLAAPPSCALGAAVAIRGRVSLGTPATRASQGSTGAGTGARGIEAGVRCGTGAVRVEDARPTAAAGVKGADPCATGADGHLIPSTKAPGVVGAGNARYRDASTTTEHRGAGNPWSAV